MSRQEDRERRSTARERRARVARATYWRTIGEPERAAAVPSGESLEAWADAIDAATSDGPFADPDLARCRHCGAEVAPDWAISSWVHVDTGAETCARSTREIMGGRR